MKKCCISLIGMNSDYFDNLFLNLTVLSKLNENEKLCIRNGNLTIENRQFEIFSRWLFSDNRNETIRFIKNLVSSCIAISSNSLSCISFVSGSPGQDVAKFKKQQILLLHRIKAALSESITGLCNLQVTYRDDISMVSSIDIIKDAVNTHLSELEEI